MDGTTGWDRDLIVATAGHVDHGKTSLVKQLTGTDTDRLEEEKRRGLSINLGFAYHKLQRQSPIGFVDVPGHNRFINTMIAGICGIDLGMLVVAADDGPMPQTIEHLDVLKLLGVQRLLLVVTKIDRVPTQRVEEVAKQVRGLLAEEGSDVPVFPVSNTSGEGVPSLLSHLEKCARNDLMKPAVGGFRLSVDRAFNLKGVGLVLTGTATGGSVNLGDNLLLQPAAETVRVRGIHVQDEEAEAARAGQRCAINVVGNVEKSAVARGDWLLDSNAGPLSPCIDTRVRLLGNAPFALKHRSPVKIYLGARRIAGRLFNLEDGKHLAPGAEVLAQIMLDSAVSCCHGERFLLRDDSESVTLGGGVVLDPYGSRTGKNRPRRLAALRALDTDSAQTALEALVVDQGQLLELDKFRHSWNLREDELAGLGGPQIQRIDADGASLLVSLRRWQQGLADIPRCLASWHRDNPHAAGINIPSLHAELDNTLEASLFAAMLKQLQQDAVLTLKDGKLAMAGYQAVVLEGEIAGWHRLEAFLRQRGSDIPRLSHVCAETGLDKTTLENIGRAALRDGRLYKLGDSRYATAQQLFHLANLVIDLVADKQPITVVNFKRRMGTGRKVTIDVLEYFDSIGFTRRKQDTREIVDAGVPARLFKK